MGQIEFKQYYTDVVEHFFRMAVRYKKIESRTSLDWFKFTKYWIARLPEEDRKFITFVFAYQFRDTFDGLRQCKCGDSLYAKRKRLADLEKRFAIDGGLHNDVDE